jgi:RNA polymerase sigma-70 factor, ECF subfamily
LIPRQRESAPSAHLLALLEKIQCGDHAAEAALCAFLRRGLRLIAQRQTNHEDIDGVLDRTLLPVVTAVRQGRVRSVEALGSLTQSILGMQRTCHTQQSNDASPAVHAEATLASVRAALQSVDNSPAQRQRLAGAHRAVAAMPAGERELLWRFYIKEETVTTICEAMGLSCEEFRAMKSQAKARFGSFGAAQLSIKARQAAPPPASHISSCA